jgi:hypothetical protein
VDFAERDQDMCADVDGIVEVDDVAPTHADANEAGWRADLALVRCSAGVDAAIPGFLILRLPLLESR